MCLPVVLCFFYYIFQSKIGRNVSGAPQVFDEMRQRDVGALERNVNATARVLKVHSLRAHLDVSPWCQCDALMFVTYM
ncbi:hypothetical protein SDJN03_19836, partial [Cucurbita argyrosperma subsp. sororia]